MMFFVLGGRESRRVGRQIRTKEMDAYREAFKGEDRKTVQVLTFL